MNQKRMTKPNARTKSATESLMEAVDSFDDDCEYTCMWRGSVLSGRALKNIIVNTKDSIKSGVRIAAEAGDDPNDMNNILYNVIDSVLSAIEQEFFGETPHPRVIYILNDENAPTVGNG